MKIGLISNPNYSKSHVRSLEKDGHEVLELGGDFVDIPPSVDLVVLRTEACSHSASDSAHSWTRATGKPLIVHNGLSGIRRALERIRPMNTPTTPPPPQPDFEKALALLRKTRPKDGEEKYRDTLIQMGATPERVRELLPNVSTFYWSVRFPVDPPHPQLDWLRALPLDRLKREFETAQEIYNRIPSSVAKKIVKTFMEASEASRNEGMDRVEFWPSSGVDLPAVEEMRGRPTRFFLVLINLLPPEYAPLRGALAEAYMEFTDKKTDHRIIDGAAWALNRQIRKFFQGPNATAWHTIYASEDEAAEAAKSAPVQPEPEEAPVEVPVPVEPEAPVETIEVVPEPEQPAAVVVRIHVDREPREEDTDAARIRRLEQQLEKMRTETDEHILELMESVAVLKRQKQEILDGVSQRWDGVIAEVREIVSEVIRQPKPPLETVSGSGSEPKDGLLDFIDALKSRGAKITIEV